jgi:hypothetical protein
MKKVLAGVGIFVGIILIIGIISASTIWSHRNTAVAIEERVNAQYVANKSNYDNMWKRFKEMSQVTELQATQVKDVYEGLIAGRYEDTDLLFKMVKEDNPKLDTSVYTQLQREISSGRQQFDNNQKQIADIVREYNTYIRKHIIMTYLTNREPMDINLFIVTSEETENTFKDKKADEINLLGK